MCYQVLAYSFPNWFCTFWAFENGDFASFLLFFHFSYWCLAGNEGMIHNFPVIIIYNHPIPQAIHSLRKTQLPSPAGGPIFWGTETAKWPIRTTRTWRARFGPRCSVGILGSVDPSGIWGTGWGFPQDELVDVLGKFHVDDGLTIYLPSDVHLIDVSIELMVIIRIDVLFGYLPSDVNMENAHLQVW